MIGYKVTYSAASGRYSITNLQTGKRSIVGRDYGASSDNYARHAVESVHGSEVVYIGQDNSYKYYAGKDE